MGIGVTRRQMRRELAAIKRENFRSAAEYHRFLRETRFTHREVYERVELQVLSERIQLRVQRRIDRETRTPAEEQKAVNEFVDEFNERWRSRTVCALEYVTGRCSNGAAAG